MILCTKHALVVGVRAPSCPLQERAQKRMLEAQRDGDSAMVLLVDRDDREHIAVASIGVGRELTLRLHMAAGMDLATRDGRPEAEEPGPRCQLPPPWHLLDSALFCYVAARHRRQEAATLTQLRMMRETLTQIMPHARYKQTDPHGRELWRSPAGADRGDQLRWVVIPPRLRGDLPFVPWVGFGHPPERLFGAHR